MAQFGMDPFQAFQAGFATRGPTALGQFAKVLTERAMKLQGIRDEARVKTDEEIRSAGPIASAKADAEMKSWSKYGQGGVGVGPGGEQPVVTGGSRKTPFGSVDYTYPEAQAQAKGMEATAIQQGKRQADVERIAGGFQGDLKNMVNLGRQIKAPTPGWMALPGGVKNWMDANVTQKSPQAKSAASKRKAVAGQLIQLVGGESSSRLSDYDVRRAIDLLSDPIWETDETRNLKNVELIDALNAIPEIKNMGGVSYLGILRAEEILSGRSLQGKGKGQLHRDAQGNWGIRYDSGETEDLF